LEQQDVFTVGMHAQVLFPLSWPVPRSRRAWARMRQ
jgi:hypothetical protein